MQRTLDPARLGDHLDRLYRAAWALCGSRQDAEDLVQETYARVLARPRFILRTRHSQPLRGVSREQVWERTVLPAKRAPIEIEGTLPKGLTADGHSACKRVGPDNGLRRAAIGMLVRLDGSNLQ